MDSTFELIAVYGSLLRAEGGLAALGATPYLEYRGPARLCGELVDLGDYPGLCPDRSLGRDFPGVAGELFAVLDPSVLRILDAYEGCMPGAVPPDATTGFRRERVTLLEPAVEAWVYLYHGPVEGRPRILGMDWTEYKKFRARKFGCERTS